VVFIEIANIIDRRRDGMADEYRMILTALLRKVQMDGDVVFLKEGVWVLSQAVMEMEVSRQLGLSGTREPLKGTGQRNGYRKRAWDTRVGTIGLKMREGSYYPSLLDPRKRGERALVAVVQEAYVQGDLQEGRRPRPGFGDERDQPGTGRRSGAVSDPETGR
jgi:hypothetical protein